MADRTVESTQESVAQPAIRTRSGVISRSVSCSAVPANASFSVFSTTTSAGWWSSSGRNAHPGLPRSKPSPALPQCLIHTTWPPCRRTMAARALMRWITPFRSCLGGPSSRPTCMSTTMRTSPDILPARPLLQPVDRARDRVDEGLGGDVVLAQHAAQRLDALAARYHAGRDLELVGIHVPQPDDQHVVAEVERAIDLAAQVGDKLLVAPVGMAQHLAGEADPLELGLLLRRGAELRDAGVVGAPVQR